MIFLAVSVRAIEQSVPPCASLRPDRIALESSAISPSPGAKILFIHNSVLAHEERHHSRRPVIPPDMPGTRIRASFFPSTT